MKVRCEKCNKLVGFSKEPVKGVLCEYCWGFKIKLKLKMKELFKDT